LDVDRIARGRGGIAMLSVFRSMGPRLQYNVDGLRFDVATQINGLHLKEVVDRPRRDFPQKYLIAEHLPDHPVDHPNRPLPRHLAL
jgi:hypothetical protein